VQGDVVGISVIEVRCEQIFAAGEAGARLEYTEDLCCHSIQLMLLEEGPAFSPRI
jgi:hypothetical protein